MVNSSRASVLADYEELDQAFEMPFVAQSYSRVPMNGSGTDVKSREKHAANRRFSRRSAGTWTNGGQHRRKLRKKTG